MDNLSNANIFVRGKIPISEKLFSKVLEYFVFCYNRLLDDSFKVSQIYCREHTTHDFEFCLKNSLVQYLQDQKNKIAFQDESVQRVEYQLETNKTYIQDCIERRDMIDIYVSNLGLQSAWNGTNAEDIYFAFECKRLKNNEKNTEYITDIGKFVDRDYWQTGYRFPFNGLIGFIEKSETAIKDIIEDIDTKIQNSDTINSIITNNSVLDVCPTVNSELCKISKHMHNSVSLVIEVYHLFFDYSDIITD